MNILTSYTFLCHEFIVPVDESGDLSDQKGVLERCYMIALESAKRVEKRHYTARFYLFIQKLGKFK